MFSTFFHVNEMCFSVTGDYYSFSFHIFLIGRFFFYFRAYSWHCVCVNIPLNWDYMEMLGFDYSSASFQQSSIVRPE